jgi:hypothetical protein
VVSASLPVPVEAVGPAASDKSNTAGIAAGVSITLIIVAVVIAVVFYRQRRQRLARKTALSLGPTAVFRNPTFSQPKRTMGDGEKRNTINGIFAIPLEDGNGTTEFHVPFGESTDEETAQEAVDNSMFSVPFESTVVAGAGGVVMDQEVQVTASRSAGRSGYAFHVPPMKSLSVDTQPIYDDDEATKGTHKEAIYDDELKEDHRAVNDAVYYTSHKKPGPGSYPPHEVYESPPDELLNPPRPRVVRRREKGKKKHEEK